MAVRSFDPDEFEHCHAAWSVFKGMLPYRDFFEHHTPWFYYALSPFFRWFAVDQSFESARRFLLLGRALSLAVTALSVVLMMLVGRLGANRKVGLLAGLFLVGQPVLIQKTMEIRPDVLALPFYLGGLWFVVRELREPAGSPRPASLRGFLGGGLCLGAAVMCTQKMLFVLPGALVGLGLWALSGGREAWRARLTAVSMVLVGVAVPAFLTWAAFALEGGGDQFIRNNFLLNATWRLRSSRHLQVTFDTSWPILVPALGGVALALRRFRRSAQRRYDDAFLLCTLGGLIVGIAVVPAAYKQYYLMPLAIVCWFAARGLYSFVDLARDRRRGWLLVGATVPLLIWPVVQLATSYRQRADAQMDRLRYVFTHTGPTDPVLDGWLGTDVFRPHPRYYFFMHRELLAMLTERELDSYLGALESGRSRPSLVALDDELKALGPRLIRFLEQRYVTDDGLFYRPALAPQSLAVVGSDWGMVKTTPFLSNAGPSADHW